MDHHPMGWPLLYKTPLGMICLYGKVMVSGRRRVKEWGGVVRLFSEELHAHCIPFQVHSHDIDVVAGRVAAGLLTWER